MTREPKVAPAESGYSVGESWSPCGSIFPLARCRKTEIIVPREGGGVPRAHLSRSSSSARLPRRGGGPGSARCGQPSRTSPQVVHCHKSRMQNFISFHNRSLVFPYLSWDVFTATRLAEHRQRRTITGTGAARVLALRRSPRVGEGRAGLALSGCSSVPREGVCYTGHEKSEHMAFEHLLPRPLLVGGPRGGGGRVTI